MITTTIHTQGVGTLALRAEAPMDLQQLTRWLLSVSTRRSHDLMRLKGILNCQSHAQAVVIQGVYQWLEVRQEAGEPPERIRFGIDWTTLRRSAPP